MSRWLAVLLDVTEEGRVVVHLDRDGVRGWSRVFECGTEFGAFVAAFLAGPAEPGDAAMAALRDAGAALAAHSPGADTPGADTTEQAPPDRS